MVAILNSEKNVVEVQFDYSESCKNVYKTFCVKINGKNSNRKGLDKYLTDKDYPSILTKNTWFWNPCGSAGERRRSEIKKNAEVREFFERNKFEIING